MHYIRLTKNALFKTLINPKRDLCEIVARIPKEIWDVFFYDAPDEFDKFIASVKKEREKNEKKAKVELQQKQLKGHIVSVTFNPPFTTVAWEDGTITKVTCIEGESYSEEVGLLNYMAKYLYNNNSQFNDVIKYWLEHGKTKSTYMDRTAKKENNPADLLNIFNMLEADVKEIKDKLEDKYIYLENENDALKLAGEIVANAYQDEMDYVNEAWKNGETLLLQSILLYMFHNLTPKKRTVANLIELIQDAEINENDNHTDSALDRLFAYVKQENPAHPGAFIYEETFKPNHKNHIKDIVYLAGIHTLFYVEGERNFMARMCPLSNEPVLYTTCQECEEKICRTKDISTEKKNSASDNPEENK